MLLSVLAWLFYPGSCLGHQATFLHMHRLNFWPGTSSQGCIRETVVLSGVVGMLAALCWALPTLTKSSMLYVWVNLRRILQQRHRHYHIIDIQWDEAAGAVCECHRHVFISLPSTSRHKVRCSICYLGWRTATVTLLYTHATCVCASDVCGAQPCGKKE